MKKNTIETILLIDVIAIIASAIIWILNIKDMYADGYDLANTIIIYGMLLCAIVAVFYVLVGCNKRYGSVLYKAFFNIFAIIVLSSLLKHQRQSNLSVIMVAIRFAGLILLSHADDLGERKTKVCSLMIFITTAVEIIALIVNGYFIYAWKGILLEVVLELTCKLLVMAKYIDKKERNAI